MLKAVMQNGNSCEGRLVVRPPIKHNITKSQSINMSKTTNLAHYFGIKKSLVSDSYFPHCDQPIIETAELKKKATVSEGMKKRGEQPGGKLNRSVTAGKNRESFDARARMKKAKIQFHSMIQSPLNVKGNSETRFPNGILFTKFSSPSDYYHVPRGSLKFKKTSESNTLLSALSAYCKSKDSLNQNTLHCEKVKSKISEKEILDQTKSNIRMKLERAKKSETRDLLSEVFEDVIKADCLFGDILREIKSQYEERLDIRKNRKARSIPSEKVLVRGRKDTLVAIPRLDFSNLRFSESSSSCVSSGEILQIDSSTLE